MAAFITPLRLGAWTWHPRLGCLVTWFDGIIATLQCPTQLPFANLGQPPPVVAVVPILATPASSAFGLTGLRVRLGDSLLRTELQHG